MLADFVAGGPTEKELTAAKKNIIGSFPLRIDSNKKIIGYLAVIGFYNLPLTYLDDYVKSVEKVTVPDQRQPSSAASTGGNGNRGGGGPRKKNRLTGTVLSP